MIHVFLVWATIASVIPFYSTMPRILQDRTIKVWNRILICILLGPAAWLIILATVCVMLFMIFVLIEKKFRAKKTSKP